MDWFKPNNDKTFANAFNKAVYSFLGGQEASYDYDNKVYLEKGYLTNPTVYSILKQKSDKARSVPYYIKTIEDRKSYTKFKQLEEQRKGDYSTKQLLQKRLLETKAFGDETELDFPLDKPNPLQSWGDIVSLHFIYMNSIGNSFIFMISPENGPNAGEPNLVYILPAHLMSIVLKKDADLLYDENPIDYYFMVEGDRKIRFEVEDIIHIKYPNPEFNMNGSHLFGFPPMRPLLRVLEASNDALNSNVKTMKNGGVFGIITAKDANQTFNAEQATAFKNNMVRMHKNPGQLSNFSVGSVPVEFTKLSLDTADLKVFDFLDYNEKQICNVFGWSDLLLNNDAASTYNNIKEIRKRVLTDTIYPDLVLFQEGMTNGFIRKFKGYEKAVWLYDITEMSEMQEDMEKLVAWMDKAWYLTPNEKRAVLKYETSDSEGMDIEWRPAGLQRVDELGISVEDVQKAYSNLDN